jgi:hypothetical protein
VDLVEGTAPTKTKKEFVYGVRAGQCGRTGHSMSNSPTFVCERKKKILDDWNNLNSLQTYQETARDELVLRRERM